MSGPVANESPLHVVVIDDDLDLLDLLSDSLITFGGYTVTTVTDGAAGLERVVTLRPDCVIVDVLMPGLNGYQFVRALRGDPATRSVPIIILSALIQEQEHLAGLLSGADMYLFKPVPIDELLAAVRQTIAITDEQRALLRAQLASIRLPNDEGS